MKRLILLLAVIFSGLTYANNSTINCFGPRLSHQIQIDNSKIKVTRPFQNIDRSLASIANARTKIKGTGFDKIFFVNGNKYLVHIENRNSFSEVDDYLTIKSSEGHTVTYPIKCQ